MNYSQYIHSFLVSNVSSLHLSLISPSSLLPPSPPPPPPPHLGGASESLLYLLRTKRGERERDTDCLIVSAHHLNLSSKLSFSSFALSHLLLFISSCRPCFILLHRISKTQGESKLEGSSACTLKARRRCWKPGLLPVFLPICLLRHKKSTPFLFKNMTNHNDKENTILP